MVDIYFKCDWCNRLVEHKHVEKGNCVFGNHDRTKKLHRVELGPDDSYICDYCYNAIQNKIENLRTCSEQEDIPKVLRRTERCEKPTDVTYVEYTDKDSLTFDKNMPEMTRTSSKDYQDNGVIVTCNNEE